MLAGTKGRSGRRAKPASAKASAGTARRDRTKTPPTPPANGVIPAPPDNLHANAAAEWERLTPIALRCGLLSSVDWLAWQLGFCSLSRFWHAQEQLAASKVLTFMTGNGYQQQLPEVGIAKQAWTEVLQFCREFGLTPSARTSIDLAEPPTSGPGQPSAADPLADLVN